MTPGAGRLVVVPSDPIADYERAGYDGLERYYNPGGFFAEVVALSPRERGERRAYGMTIVGVAEARFAEALRERRPAVVRAYGGGWTTDLVTRARVPGVPVVASVHSTHPDAVRRSLRYADLVWCTSRAVVARVRAHGVPEARIRVLPNRVDPAVFSPTPDPAVVAALARRFPAGRHVLHVGRKSEQKNLDTVIRSVPLLPPDYHAIFVGLGDAAPYRELARALGVADRCSWVDAVPNRELATWYAWCDCLCTPSRWEGFGIVFIEAAAAGAPIVTADIAPMNEYLVHDVSACLVRRHEDPRAIADAVRRVVEDAAYRRRLAAGAVAAARPFHRDVVDAREIALYREALALGGRCRPPLSAAERWGLDARRAGHRLLDAARAAAPRPVKRLARQLLRARRA